MARARQIGGIGADTPFREAAARAIEVRAEEVFALGGTRVLDTVDIERVHDMRVATRRLRAVMEIFAGCFPKRDYRRALRDVKALADVLGARRDCDVRIELAQRLAEAMTADDRPGIKSLISELRGRQQIANAGLGKMLQEIEAEDLRARLLALSAGARTS